MEPELDDDEKNVLKLLRGREEAKLGESVREISTHLNTSEEKVTRILYLLWKKGYLDVIDGKARKGLFSYLLSWESLWYWILVGYVAITCLVVALVLKPPLIYLRYALGSVLVLYVPGAVLIESLYPASELKPLERFALSIGLSLAIVPLIGLFLNYTPWGIRLTPVLYSLILFSLIVGLIAAIRKYKARP